MLTVKNLTFKRENKSIIQNLSFKLNKGEILGIVGPSGEGKSTLLKLIAGLLQADSGKISLNGTSILGPKDKLIPGTPDIQLVNQDYALDLYHSVEENILVKCQHLSTEIRHNYLEELLTILNLSSLRKKQAINLSGGEQQRLAIARAFALEPEILLLDEPFAHIDVHLYDEIYNYLKLLNKIRKTSIIIVSHNGQELLHFTEKIAFFKNGQFSKCENARIWYELPTNKEEASYFGFVNEINVNRKTYLFRPHQFKTQTFENAIELVVNFSGIEYYGIFQLHVFSFKKQQIKLILKDDIISSDLKSIYICASNG